MTWKPAAGLKDFAGNPLAPRRPNRVRCGPTRQRLLTLQRSDKLVAAALV